MRIVELGASTFGQKYLDHFRVAILDRPMECCVSSDSSHSHPSSSMPYETDSMSRALANKINREKSRLETTTTPSVLSRSSIISASRNKVFFVEDKLVGLPS